METHIMDISTAKSIRRTLTSLAIVAAGFSAGGARADLANGIVDQWSVGVVAQFLCDTALWTGSAQDCAANSMTWGTDGGDGRSGLDITNPAGPTIVNTNGPSVPNVAVTHRNNPITGSTLDEVKLRSTLTLTPFSPPDTGLPSASLDFLIDFQETSNGADPCANGDANGVGVNVNGCGDIFVIDQGALNFAFQYDLGTGQGLKTYFISFFEQTGGLNPLPVAACNAVGVTSPCLGFVTPEQASTTFNFAAVITTKPVEIPVPGTLVSVGLGLLLLGLRRRRA
jgi:hypothetical protein